MDFAHCASERKLEFSPDGKYNLRINPEMPILLRLYRFSHAHPAIPNYHDALEITYILQGIGKFTIGRNEYVARERDIFTVGSGVFHLLDSSDDRLQNLALYFFPELIYVPGTSDLNLEYLLLFAAERQRFSAKVTTDRDTNDRVLKLLQCIARVLHEKPEFYRIEAKNCLCAILHLLNQAAQVTASERASLHLPLRDASRLRSVFEAVQRRYTGKIAVNELARAAWNSPDSVDTLIRHSVPFQGGSWISTCP
jgi:hypothetical protein